MKIIIVMINLSTLMFVFFFFLNSDLRLYRVETVILLSLKFFKFSLNNKYMGKSLELLTFQIHFFSIFLLLFV